MRLLTLAGMIVILIGLFVPGLSFGIGTIIIGLLIILISEIRPGATQPEHTVTCQACGHQNSEKAEFCENCGTKFRDYAKKGKHSFMLKLQKGKGYVRA